jgi:hypothetical protein
MSVKMKTIAAFVFFLSLCLAPGLAAQGTPIPLTYLAEEAEGGADAVASASPKAEGPRRFFGFESEESFHRFSGWASGGILLAAGVVGAVHAYDMMSKAHDWRDAHGIDEFNSDLCPEEIAAVYNDPTEKALRWTHVGLLVAGESFYFANAFTGAKFMAPLGPGWSKAKIHRYAFFVHAGLMVAEGVLGFLSTDALQRGDHEAFTGLLAAHAGIGLAIPVVIIGAGVVMDPKLRIGD